VALAALGESIHVGCLLRSLRSIGRCTVVPSAPPNVRKVIFGAILVQAAQAQYEILPRVEGSERSNPEPHSNRVGTRLLFEPTRWPLSSDAVQAQGLQLPRLKKGGSVQQLRNTSVIRLVHEVDLDLLVAAARVHYVDGVVEVRHELQGWSNER
jgi:hypothetical protein